MRLISHRGNIRGKKIQLENEPSYIDVALKEGYDVEIDLWIDDDGFYLGHDEPIYPIELKWLTDRYLNLWIHCKSLKTIEKLKELEFEVGLTSLNYFCMKMMMSLLHQKDTFGLSQVFNQLNIVYSTTRIK